MPTVAALISTKVIHSKMRTTGEFTCSPMTRLIACHENDQKDQPGSKSAVHDGVRISPTGSKLLSHATSVANMPVITNTGATLLIGHESAKQRLGHSCRTSPYTTMSNDSTLAKFLMPVTHI